MADDNVTRLPGSPTPAPEVLLGERAQNAKQLIVLGWDKDDKFFLSATHGQIAANCYLLDICKHTFMKHVTGG